jgi:hypothetical protein
MFEGNGGTSIALNTQAAGSYGGLVNGYTLCIVLDNIFHSIVNDVSLQLWTCLTIKMW